ncbi:MAG: gliding motility-associated C-terminal domain-containing protein [Bacteroidia bacterium]
MGKSINKHLLAITFVVTFCINFAQSQNINAINANWTIRNPFEQKVFIENNEGQFDGDIDSGKVLFSGNIDGINIYFTSRGLIYRYDELPRVNPKEKDEPEHETDKKDTPEPIRHFFSFNWEGANQDVEIIAEDEVSFYYCYPANDKHTTIAHAFKKLLYKNLYQGIDIEYSFPDDKSGIEYSIIVHPGADLSKVILKYPDAISIIDSSGDIKMKSTFGEFIDHSPANIFYKEDNSPAAVAFALKINEITFNTVSHDKNKTLVIDPWTTNPGFTNYNAGYDLRYDFNGNVYVYGGYTSNGAVYQVIKINNAGVVQWIFNTTYYGLGIGDITVDKTNGDIYAAGAVYGIIKINNSGKQVKYIPIPGPGEEIWKLGFDECNNHIIIGGGGTGDTCSAAWTDTSLSKINQVDILGSSTYFHDIGLLTIDQNDGFCYLATVRALTYPTLYNNIMVKCALPGLFPTLFSVSDGYSFIELSSIKYVGDNPIGVNGFNGMAVSPNWLYTYDGATLKRFDKNTGSLTKTFSVSGTPFTWGGLDADNCDNIYVGNVNEIDEYDSAFNNIGTIAMAATSDTIYDVRVTNNNTLYACGKGFVSSFNVNEPPVSISITGSPACSECNGTAFVTLNNCYTNAALYNWSDGQTTQVATGLCGGNYKVSVMIDCIAYTDSVTITSTSNPSVEIPTSKINEINCIGEDNGSATAIASGGTPPFTYTWLPTGITGETVDNLGQGSYTVIVRDTNGCSATASVDMNSMDYQLFIPDAFSPNGNGVNDLLYVRSNCIKSMIFEIFDRWGNKVFETNSQSVPWDGTYNGKPMNTGTYVYYLNATMYDGKTVEKKGSVALVR